MPIIAVLTARDLAGIVDPDKDDPARWLGVSPHRYVVPKVLLVHLYSLAFDAAVLAELGAELLMGAETVKTHLSHVYDKLGLHSRAALASEFATRTDSTATR